MIKKKLETKEDYNKLFFEYEKTLKNKQKHLQKIIELGKNNKIALMCFEKDINMCHRNIIKKQLEKNGFTVNDF